MQHARGSEQRGLDLPKGPNSPKALREPDTEITINFIAIVTELSRRICIDSMSMFITILTDTSRQQREADCLSDAEVWAFGDDANDVRMLSEVGRRLRDMALRFGLVRSSLLFEPRCEVHGRHREFPCVRVRTTCEWKSLAFCLPVKPVPVPFPKGT